METQPNEPSAPTVGAGVSHPRPDPGRGIYGISVAAELVGMGIQNLRLYERRGLLEPERTPAGTRRYSDNDLARLRRIGELLTAGLNLAGIERVLDLEAANAQLRAELADTYRHAGLPVPDRHTPSSSGTTTPDTR